jgi:uncharacterized protein YbaR (Trm112 family)
MHILLTDVVSCPRCGPEFGLILLADRVEERRVLAGRLGCPNCREQYPVSGGVLDARLPADRTPAASDDASAEPDSEDTEAAVRLAALLGLADARGTVLVAGPGAALAGAIAEVVPELEVVALSEDPPLGGERPGVSRVLSRGPLPFRGRTLRGVALTGGGDAAALAEGLRVLQPGVRLVAQRAPAGTAETLATLGARVMLDQEGTVVAMAAGEPVQLRMNAVR